MTSSVNTSGSVSLQEPGDPSLQGREESARYPPIKNAFRSEGSEGGATTKALRACLNAGGMDGWRGGGAGGLLDDGTVVMERAHLRAGTGC